MKRDHDRHQEVGNVSKRRSSRTDYHCSLQQLSPSSSEKFKSEKKMCCVSLEKDFLPLVDNRYTDEKESGKVPRVNKLLQKFVEALSVWIAKPPELTLGLLRQENQLTINSLPLTKTDAVVLLLPKINIDIVLMDRPEFCVEIAQRMGQYLNTVEERWQSVVANYHSWLRDENNTDTVADTIPDIHDNAHSDTSGEDREDLSTYKYFRSIVVELMIALSCCSRLQLLPETLHYAVSMFDRFVATKLTGQHGSESESLPSCDDDHDDAFGANLVEPQSTSSFRTLTVEPVQLLNAGVASLLIAVKLEEQAKFDKSLYINFVLPLLRVWQQVFDTKGDLPVQTHLFSFYDQDSPALRSPSAEPCQSQKHPVGNKPVSVDEVEQPPSVDTHGQSPLSPTTFSTHDENTLKSALFCVERNIVQALKWELLVPSIYTFLSRYMVAGNLQPYQCLRARCLADRALLDSSIMQYPPSLIAACIVSMMRQIVGFSGWTSTLVYFTGYSEDMLRVCLETIRAVCQKELQLWQSPLSPLHPYKAGASVRAKYTDYIYQFLLPLSSSTSAER